MVSLMSPSGSSYIQASSAATRSRSVYRVESSNSSQSGPSVAITDTLDLSPEAQAASRSEAAQDSASVEKPPVTVRDDLLEWAFGISETEDPDESLLKMHHLLQTEEERLQTRITTLLEENGLFLGEDDRLELEVGLDGTIHVGGIENEDTAAHIEQLLAEDETLGRDLLTHYARKNAFDATLLGEYKDVDTRAWAVLLDDLLIRETGVSLTALQFDGTAVTSENAEVAELLAENDKLREKIVAVLSDKSWGEEPITFVVEDGMLIDTQTVDQTDIKLKIERLEQLLLEVPGPITIKGQEEETADSKWDSNEKGPWLRYNENALDGRRIMDFQISGDGSGEIEVEGDTLDRFQKGAVRSWFDAKIDHMAQVAVEDILKQHQLADGDLGEFEHQVLLSLDYIHGIEYEVRSDEADSAIREELTDLSVRLQTSLNQTLIENDVFVEPFEVSMDESGRLTVRDDSKTETRENARLLIEALGEAAARTNAPANSPAASQEEPSALDILIAMQELAGQLHSPSNRTLRMMIGGR